MEFYKYTIDANEPYEDWMCTSIFSTELIPRKEFEEIVKKAIEVEGEWAEWSSVANWIVENDERFFIPRKGHLTIVKNNGSFEGVI